MRWAYPGRKLATADSRPSHSVLRGEDEPFLELTLRSFHAVQKTARAQQVRGCAFQLARRHAPQFFVRQIARENLAHESPPYLWCFLLLCTQHKGAQKVVSIPQYIIIMWVESPLYCVKRSACKVRCLNWFYHDKISTLAYPQNLSSAINMILDFMCILRYYTV